jgi:multidrug efflux pump subunit AcrB
MIQGGAGGIISYFVRHRTIANLLMILILAAGVWSGPQLRAQFFPDIVIDEVSVSVRWAGAGPEDVDRAIVQLLEPALQSVEGVAASTAVAREGSASIRLEFEPGWDMQRAADEVQAAVDAVTNLPDEADEPRVDRSVWRDRVTDVVVTGPVGVDQLARFADEFVNRLFQSGVTRATIQGIAAPGTLVEVPSVNLIRHQVEMAEIAAAIAGESAASPAGDVAGANARVRTGVARRSAAEIAAIVVRSNPDGSTLTVGDVGTVYSQGVDRDRAYFVGDNPAITIRVDRTDRGDAIEMQRRVERIAQEVVQGLPQGVTIDLIRTRAEAITGRLNILLENGLMGLSLVVLLLFLFLNARTAFWVAAGIPVAMAAAIALMYAMGLTLNMISLFALIITLGIVVDDAIVVGEHADYRARELGEPPPVAAENAARRMALPVFASTITTVIAFLGLVAVGGRFGNMIADIPTTVCLVLIASLVECFLILPRHMVHALAHSARSHWYDWPSRQVNRGFRWFRENLFRPFMAGVIWARYPVLALAVLLLAIQSAQFIRGDVQWRFFDSPEQGSISGNFAMLPGAARGDTIEMMREVQRATDAVAARYEAEHGLNPLTYVIAEVGGNTGRALAGAEGKEESQLGSIAIEMIGPDLRSYTSFQFLADLQQEVRNHPMLEELSFRGWRSGPGGDALSVQFFGATAETLKSAAEDLKAALLPFPEVSAVEDTLAYDKEELVLDLTARGQALGFTIDGIGRVLRDRLNGIEAATYPDGPRSAAIRVELPARELTADFLERTQMRAPSGAYVPLADIVTVERQAGFSSVRRENGLRVITVSGDIDAEDAARAAEINQALRDTILPRIESTRGVGWRLSGLAEQEQEFISDSLMGFIACVLGIYLVLAWIFSSWTRPLVVMSVIPFGLVGAIYGHAYWGVPLSMFSIVGLIGMTGIIINDSIVLVTRVDEYAQDRGSIPAIIDGASDRLRPVILTTLTTVLGLAPLLFESSQDAQFLRPTVITLVYGLGFGMFLVLLVIPALLAMQRDMAVQVQGLRRALAPRAGGGFARAVTVATGAALAIAFAATLGARLVTGAAPGWIPGSDNESLGPVVLAFAGLAALVVVVAYLLAALLAPSWAGPGRDRG